MAQLISFILHFDEHLSWIFAHYGTATYALLFVIIFAETGLVLTPFLPGDSLLFGVGAFAAQGALNLYIVLGILTAAAIMGDTMNYWIGYHLGPRVFKGRRLFKAEYLEKTKIFYAKHGKKTIILARFVPIVRTFAPFVAGIGKMDYKIFICYNILGGIAWISLFTVAGYFLGSLPWVQNNFGLFIIGIIIVSVLPLMIEIVKSSRQKTANPTTQVL